MNNAWTIRLFAGLAERFGGPVVTLPAGRGEMTVRELKEALAARYPEHAAAISSAFIARNQEYAADADTVLAEDELAMLPPVSGGEDPDPADGGCGSQQLYFITEEPLSVEEIAAAVNDPNHGAALAFVGTTREWTRGKRTVRLEYEAYEPMAVGMMRKIGEEIGTRWPGARCAIGHRIGVVEIAEASVVIAVSAPHREACYEASRYAIERLKQVVPIWKKEIWEDGSEWKGAQTGPWNPLAEPGMPG